LGPGRILLQEELDLAGPVGDVGEADLAHGPFEHHPAADADARRVRVEPFTIALAIGVLQLAGERRTAVVVREGRPARAQGRELPAALRDQLVLLPVLRRIARAVVLLLVCHVGYSPALSEASMN